MLAESEAPLAVTVAFTNVLKQWRSGQSTVQLMLLPGQSNQATLPVGGYLPHLALQSLHDLHVDVPAQLGLIALAGQQHQLHRALARAPRFQHVGRPRRVDHKVRI